jgi:hypothetical protein
MNNRLLAIMGGVLNMDGEQLVKEFAQICRIAFAKDKTSGIRKQELQDEIRRIVREYSSGSGGEERMMLSGDNACKV